MDHSQFLPLQHSLTHWFDPVRRPTSASCICLISPTHQHTQHTRSSTCPKAYAYTSFHFLWPRRRLRDGDPVFKPMTAMPCLRRHHMCLSLTVTLIPVSCGIAAGSLSPRGYRFTVIPKPHSKGLPVPDIYVCVSVYYTALDCFDMPGSKLHFYACLLCPNDVPSS